MSTTTDALWKGEDNALARALADADEAERSGDVVDANVARLSAYITTLDTNVPENREAAAHIASELREQWKSLNHNQLDVLLGWYLTAALSDLDVSLLQDMADREVKLAESEAKKPHQKALAYITRAHIELIQNNTDAAKADAARALALEEVIRSEDDRQYGLRQLVRILHSAGKILDRCGDNGLPYLTQALALAEGEADTPPNAEAIRETLEKRA